METLNLLSLFSGSGQLDRSVEAALANFGIQSRIVCYVEENKACQEVIRARVRDGLLQDAPIWPDVVTFPGGRLRGHVDGIVCGFPCQPFSVAGKKLGTRDERYLFGDVMRIADEFGCELLFMENTPGLLIPDSDRPDEPSTNIRRISAHGQKRF
jgi:DNA (cytosine-5)-methyltransferase 1